MKKKIFEIFKKAIESFENLDKIELIATFGSITKFDNANFDDLDVITISDKRYHDDFISHLQNRFKKENFEPIVFKSILNQPKKKNEEILLLHDLHYYNLEDLLKKEWKTVLDAMRIELIVLHGDKNFSRKIIIPKTLEKDIIDIIKNWVKNIFSKKEFDLFQKHWEKIIPRYIKRYDYLKLLNLREIQKLFNQKFSWNKKLEEIISLIAQI